MASSRLAYTPATIGKIQGTDPPLVGHKFLGDTEVAKPWLQQPHDAHCPPMRHHIIGGVFRGEGTTSLKIGRTQLEVQSRTGTIIINPKGTEGWWRCTGSPLVSNVFLGEERLQRCSDEIGKGGRPELLLSLQLHDPKLFTLLSLIADEQAEEDGASKLYVEHLVDAVCLHLLRSHAVFPLVDRFRRGGLAPSQARRVIEYMENHLSDEIRLQDLADLVGRSRFHFCRAFSQTTGFTPHQALTRLRVERARALLSNPARSITDVALVVGYQTPSSFAQAFWRVVGQSPSEYRRNL